MVIIAAQQQILTVDFATFDYEDAKKQVAAVSDEVYKSAKLFFIGDHWQDRDAWIGPHPAPDDPEAAAVWADLEANLVSHPGVEEVTNRHRDAIIGQEPFWSAVVRRPMKPGEKPKDSEQKLIDDAEALLTDWWDSKDPLEVLQEAVEDLALGGRGLVRLFIPEGELSEDEEGTTFIPDGPLAQQMDRIWPTFIPADEGVVAIDPLTMSKFGIFLYEIADEDGNSLRYAELTHLDPSTGETLIKTVTENGKDLPKPTTLQLGRRLMMHEMKSRPLITNPVLANQKLLNKALTMRSINVDLGGFLERVILNGQLPGEFQDIDGKKVFVPGRFQVGAGTTNVIAGVQTGTKDDGSPVIADPHIQYRDPVDVTTFDKTEAAAYRNILSATRQVHVLMSADATASGEARKQARDDYTKSLKRTKTRLDKCGRWMLEAVLQASATLAGEPTKFTSLRIMFDSQLDPGPLSADDRAAIVSEYQVNLRSQEGSMALLGITDTKAEQMKIQAEKEAAALIMTPQEKLTLERTQLGITADKAALSGSGTGGPGNDPPAPA